MSTLEIVGIAYIALDIILGIIIYAIIRCKGWTKWDMAVNFRNLLHLRNRKFKQTIAHQIGYADYGETYREGYDNGYDEGYNARVEEEEEERKRAEERKYKTYLGGDILNGIFGLFGGLFK